MRRSWEIPIMSWLALLLSSILSAPVAPAPRFKVVKAENPEKTAIALNELADQGYRLIVSGRMFILRLEATPPDTYRYLVVNFKPGPVEFLNWLNEQGSRGYLWLPRAGVMEKEPHPRNFEYILPGPTFRRGQKRSDEISSLIQQGYQPLGFTTFYAYIGPSTRETYFQRQLGMEPKRARSSAGPEIQIADAMRADNVLKQINALAEKGYRYFGAYESQKGGGRAVMMKKCETDCEGFFEYRYFDVHDRDQLVKELNDRGKEGFRVVPDALSVRPHLLERTAGQTEKFAYRAMQFKDPALLEGALNSPEQEGYEPIGYVWHSGWTAEEFLILENVAMASTAQLRVQSEVRLWK